MKNLKTIANIKLPKKDRPIGLYLFCNRHKNYYRDDSKIKCTCKNLVYKAKIHIPHSNNKCKTKILSTDDFDEALNQIRAFKKEMFLNSYQSTNFIDKKTKPILLTDCMVDFMAFLNNEGVPFHNQKIRDKKVIRNYKLSLEYYGYALKENNIDPTILKFTEVNETMIGFVCRYILETRKLSNKTYNGIISQLKSFTKYIIDKHSLKCKNHFEEVIFREENIDVKSINLDEFVELLKLVTYENSWHSEKNRARRNFYKPWLTTAYKLGLFTGGRREEVIKLTWNGVKTNRKGELSHIEINHFKKNRAKSNIKGDNNISIKRIPMNYDLEQFLIELGYHKYKNTDNYIIEPEEKNARSYMMRLITKSFSKYYKMLGNGESKQFKHLRKTYITALYIIRGEEVYKYTDHEGMAILHKHYIDEEVVMDAKQKEFKKLGSIFTSS